MTEENQSFQVASEGGLAATHKPVAIQPVLVGPSTAGEFNALRTALIPVACWRVDDLRFAFDSSFVTPGIEVELANLVQLRKEHPECPLSIFGHADPVGDDDYNKKLSGRRATAIYALLIVNSDPERAVSLWRQISGTENWGAEQQKTMRANVPDGTSDSDLFKAYMQSLCPEALMLTPKDFLAQGADAGGKGDYQGCSEFNPVLIFSQKDQTKFEQDNDKTARNTANAPNRRVMVLLFRKGSKVDPAKWPCPRAKEGVAGCKKRFWSDGEQRRSKRLPDEPRKFEETKDTFACRFYQRLVDLSRCESILERFVIRLYDQSGKYIPNAPCRITLGNREGYLDRANEDGMIVLRDIETPKSCQIEWGFKPEKGKEPELIFSFNLLIVGPEQSEEEEIKKKLNNLGYAEIEQKENVEAFQRDYGHLSEPPLLVKGELDDRTKKLLRDVYDKCAPDLRKTKVD